MPKPTSRGCLLPTVLALIILPASCWGIDRYAVSGEETTVEDVQEAHDLLTRLEPDVPLPDGARPAGFGTGQVSLDPADPDAAAVAHRIARWPASGFIELFICGDACPGWTLGDPVTLSRSYDFDVVEAADACPVELDALHNWGSEAEERPTDPDTPGIVCEFTATVAGGVEASIVFLAADEAGETVDSAQVRLAVDAGDAGQ